MDEQKDLVVPEIKKIPELDTQSSPTQQVMETLPQKGNRLIIKVIAIGTLVVGMIIVAAVISMYRGEASGKNKYEAAKQRCGHEPIIYDDGEGGLWETAAGLGVGPAIAPSPGNKYFCTMSEARAAGYSQQDLDYAIPADKRNLYY